MVGELTAYAVKNIAPDARGEIQVALARIKNNVDIQVRRLPQIDAWIASQSGASQVKAGQQSAIRGR